MDLYISMSLSLYLSISIPITIVISISISMSISTSISLLSPTIYIHVIYIVMSQYLYISQHISTYLYISTYFYTSISLYLCIFSIWPRPFWRWAPASGSGKNISKFHIYERPSSGAGQPKIKPILAFRGGFGRFGGWSWGSLTSWYTQVRRWHPSRGPGVITFGRRPECRPGVRWGGDGLGWGALGWEGGTLARDREL